MRISDWSSDVCSSDLLRQRRLVQQHAARRRAAATDAAAKLVQLRKPEVPGVLDDHQRGVGHVDVDLDHRGRHQQVESSEEHTFELQSLMRISSAVLRMKQKQSDTENISTRCY